MKRTKKTKRNRIDSVASQVAIAQAKPPEIPPYITISADEKPFWDAIISARDFSAWTEPDLFHVATLARAKAKIERLENELRTEPDIVENAAGSPIINPKHKIIEDLARRAISLSRFIHVHAEATSGPARKERERNKMHRQVKNSMDDLDDLIAKPIIN